MELRTDQPFQLSAPQLVLAESYDFHQRMSIVEKPLVTGRTVNFTREVVEYDLKSAIRGLLDEHGVIKKREGRPLCPVEEQVDQVQVMRFPPPPTRNVMPQIEAHAKATQSDG